MSGQKTGSDEVYKETPEKTAVVQRPIADRRKEVQDFVDAHSLADILDAITVMLERTGAFWSWKMWRGDCDDF
jgi:hypothetical protein